MKTILQMAAITAFAIVGLVSCMPDTTPETVAVQEARGDAVILEAGRDFFSWAVVKDKQTGQRVLVVGDKYYGISAVPLNEKPQPLEGH